MRILKTYYDVNIEKFSPTNHTKQRWLHHACLWPFSPRKPCNSHRQLWSARWITALEIGVPEPSIIIPRGWALCMRSPTATVQPNSDFDAFNVINKSPAVRCSVSLSCPRFDQLFFLIITLYCLLYCIYISIIVYKISFYNQKNKILIVSMIIHIRCE